LVFSLRRRACILSAAVALVDAVVPAALAMSEAVVLASCLFLEAAACLALESFSLASVLGRVLVTVVQVGGCAGTGVVVGLVPLSSLAAFAFFTLYGMVKELRA
jgi:hypothetical protein